MIQVFLTAFALAVGWFWVRKIRDNESLRDMRARAEHSQDSRSRNDLDAMNSATKTIGDARSAATRDIDNAIKNGDDLGSVLDSMGD